MIVNLLEEDIAVCSMFCHKLPHMRGAPQGNTLEQYHTIMQVSDLIQLKRRIPAFCASAQRDDPL